MVQLAQFHPLLSVPRGLDFIEDFEEVTPALFVLPTVFRTDRGFTTWAIGYLPPYKAAEDTFEEVTPATGVAPTVFRTDAGLSTWAIGAV